MASATEIKQLQRYFVPIRYVLGMTCDDVANKLSMTRSSIQHIAKRENLAPVHYYALRYIFENEAEQYGPIIKSVVKQFMDSPDTDTMDSRARVINNFVRSFSKRSGLNGAGVRVRAHILETLSSIESW